MSTTNDLDTPKGRKFEEAIRQIHMAEMLLSDKLTDGERWHRWRAVKQAIQFVKVAVENDIITVDQLVGAVRDDRYL